MTTGFVRPDGRVGARNHALVLPSVVCAGFAALRIAGRDAVSIAHQHGCAHVGDDAVETEQAFLDLATSPNVGGVVVTSLGCETIQGRRVADRIEAAGQRLEFVRIQTEGGVERTVQAGRAGLARLQEAMALDERVPVAIESVVVGIDAPDDPLSARIRAVVEGAGARAVTVDTSGPESHVALAGQGAQVIVSLCGPWEAPLGFVVCPIVAVARDAVTFDALADDFDVDAPADGDEQGQAESVWDAVLAAFGGEPTAAEARGARDLVLHRLARTM